MTKQLFAIAGGVLFVASLCFFAVSYGWRFAGTGGPWSIVAARRPIVIDIVLFTSFALHHSVFARVGVKAWIAQVGDPSLERSIYVWIASLLFVAVCQLWQPLPGLVWQVTGLAATLMLAGQICGAIFAVLSARRLDVLELAGVRQVFDPPPRVDQRLDTGPYGWVRHPIYLGWFAMVWLTPIMNGTRLAFAVISCAYLIIAIPFEERDLRRMFGAAYVRYAQRVRWRIVPGIY